MPSVNAVRSVVLAASVGFLAPASVARAQAIIVVVSDSTRGNALEGALVSLLDRNADLLIMQRTRDDGRITFPVKEGAGHYAISVQRFGFQSLVSTWIPVANTDTLEVTIRLRPVTELPAVVITGQRDSVAPLLPPGINPKAMSGRIIVPAEIDQHSMGARDFVDVLGSVGIAGLTTRIVAADRFRPEHRCVASVRSRSCVEVYVNNMRMTPDQAVDLATPENLDFAVWLRGVDAGVLYGTGSLDGVLLLYTKDFRRARSARPPDA